MTRSRWVWVLAGCAVAASCTLNPHVDTPSLDGKGNGTGARGTGTSDAGGVKVHPGGSTGSGGASGASGSFATGGSVVGAAGTPAGGGATGTPGSGGSSAAGAAGSRTSDAGALRDASLADGSFTDAGDSGADADNAVDAGDGGA
jgi:two-component system chemotaxis sensor kinase CheA